MTEVSGQQTIPLADRAKDFPESDIRRMFDLAREHNGDLVRLEIGEPDFTTPEHIIDAAAEAAKDGATHYTHNAGIEPLRRAIAAELGRDSNIDPAPLSEIAVTAGGMEAIYFALLATVNAGGEVLIPTPGWPNYFTQAGVLELNPVEVPMPADQGYALDADAIAEAATPETEAIILTAPSNPTGRVPDPDEVRAVLDVAADVGAHVIADEVYGKLVYVDGKKSIAAIADDPSRVTSVGSLSKSHAMTGWRVGWMYAAPEIVDAARKFQQATTTCAPSISQHAALAALEGPQAPIEEMKAAFRERRDYVTDRIADIPEISAPTPEGGFYTFVDVSFLEGNSFDVAERLLTDYGVVVVPGSGFGGAGEGNLRLSFANSLDRLELGFDRIEAMIRAER